MACLRKGDFAGRRVWMARPLRWDATRPRACGWSSDLDLTAIDEELDAIDEAGFVGCQEQHRLGDLVGLADAACGDQGGEIVLRALGLLAATEQLVQARSVGDAWADRVHADVPVLEVEDPVAGEVPHRRLGRRIHAEGWRARNPGG